MTSPNLAGLTMPPARPPSAPSVPRPPYRWTTRLVVPLLLFLTLSAVLSFSARDLIRPRTDVWVAPVIAKAIAASPDAQAPTASRTLLAQAPCWVEPAPYAITVPALTSGVVVEVTVLEGDRVESGQIVARLQDEDAKLAAQRAEAELAERTADVERAKADIQVATLRADEIRDEVSRMRPLVSSGAVSAGEATRLELRLRGAEQAALAAKAQLARSEAAVRTHQVMCDEARLALDRTQIRATASGIVLARFVEPGSRIDLNEKTGDRMTGDVLKIYDPTRLQVRADVPLADAAKIAGGIAAEVTTEALPDAIFHGHVTLVGHEANIQRNTVPVKVAIESPSPALKPEMLGRVRFFSSGTGTPTGEAPTSSTSPMRLMVATNALINQQQDKATVWLVDATGHAQLRNISTTGITDGYAIIQDGLNVGDRVIVDPPPTLKSGAKVRVVGEKATGGNP